MNQEERKQKKDLLERMRMGIIKGKLNGWFQTPVEQRPALEVKLAKLCVRYNKLKKELGIS